MEEEKREVPRSPVKIEIMFKEFGSFIRVYMLNVSNGGLFIKTENPLPLDSPVHLKMKLPGEANTMEVEGRVVWNNPKGRKNSFPKGMGIQFVKMLPEYAEKMQGFVEKYRKEIENHSIF